ncbi:4-hydroxy-2-oxoglutarate aldolase, mitochondrial [Perkinsus olseni]|uniref:4-hydroxy-2-oxoglutarate aldolase, mitochondrial n=1 Tax=Perkinsus olseni TaxID=32597 RepID=A0A7J6LWR4_PEROL|nr:4-hydroxy-2-oxoglutarate aldolase, mitochondrial [Perkinsus olseni]
MPAVTVASLKGIYPPIATPFADDGTLDDNKMISNIKRWSSATRLSGIVCQGSNGEYVLLSTYERVKIVREHMPAQWQLIVGTEAGSTAATIDMTKRVAAVGADAALVLTPSCYKSRMSDEAITSHYTSIADASPIPVILYNMPANTGVDLSVAAICHLARHKNIIGLKDSSGNVVKMATVRRKTDKNEFSLLAGSAGFLLPALSIGAVGGVCALANIAPQLCCDIQEAFDTGDFHTAMVHQHRAVEINTAVTSQFGVPGLKYAMDMLGLHGGPCRAPLVRLTDDEKRKLDAILRDSQATRVARNSMLCRRASASIREAEARRRQERTVVSDVRIEEVDTPAAKEVKNMIRRQNALAAADAKRAGLRREHPSVSNDAAHFLKRMGGIRLDSSGLKLAMDNDTRRLVEGRNRELRDRRGASSHSISQEPMSSRGDPLCVARKKARHLVRLLYHRAIRRVCDLALERYADGSRGPTLAPIEGVEEDSDFGNSAKFRETQLRYTYSRIPTYLTDSEASLRTSQRSEELSLPSIDMEKSTDVGRFFDLNYQQLISERVWCDDPPVEDGTILPPIHIRATRSGMTTRSTRDQVLPVSADLYAFLSLFMSGQKPLHFLRQTPWWREVEKFLESGKDSKALPKKVNSAERDVIRQICKHFDCSFKVKGVGTQRQMYLIKPDFSYFDRVEADQAAAQALAVHSRAADESTHGDGSENYRKAVATLSASVNRLKDVLVDRSFRLGQTQVTMARDERKLEIATREADILRKLVAAYEGIVHKVSETFAGAVKEMDMDHVNALQKEMSSLRARGREATQYSLCVRCSRAAATTAVLPCGHVFCSDCASRIYEAGKCVICRQKTEGGRGKTIEPSSKADITLEILELTKDQAEGLNYPVKESLSKRSRHSNEDASGALVGRSEHAFRTSSGAPKAERFGSFVLFLRFV